jgi:hypothetical protein
MTPGQQTPKKTKFFWFFLFTKRTAFFFLKRFFFEKKNQKTFVFQVLPCRTVDAIQVAGRGVA